MTDFPPDDATAFRPPDSRPSSGDHRFAPGSIIGGRYRIISMVGAGGMGEIYRADDLKLGQQVALKFLPRHIDSGAVDRLYSEVRVGRHISHPNVCRLYDIGEFDGHHFITMEFVDGEDLASLLRRIGRLPSDKAVAIARDICHGLAAAHHKGVVHRDLKPANIMVDGSGSARVSDFGLAEFAGDAARSNDFAGTPAYMAPEQLTGGPASVRSDIYALGVVLYEMFTGRRLFNASTIAELREQHGLSKTRPSSVVNDIDPAVERLILRCLEEDPAERPPSMHAVLAGLPGGDPLQAAIAAGETPSPQMVAAAGEVGDLAPRRAWLLLAGFVVATLIGAWANQYASLLGYVRDVRSRDVLLDRARAVVKGLGYESGADRASWYATNLTYVDETRKKGADAMRALSSSAPPGALLFEYRERDEPLRPAGAPKLVTLADPAPIVPSDTWIQLDHHGRLRGFSRVAPSQVAPSSAAVDWSPLFREAGLDPARFRESAPRSVPPVGSDRRHAWTGSFAERPDLPVRVEAASVGGRPVFFRLSETSLPPRAPRRPAGRVVWAVMVFTVLISAGVLARRNTLRGRGDVKGARRLAVAATAAFTISDLTLTHFVAEPETLYMAFVDSFAIGLYSGFFVFLAYLAVEPYVRRRWPKILIGSSRLVAGRWRDALAGREVLYGFAFGATAFALTRLVHAAAVVSGFVNPLNPLAQRMNSGAAPVIGTFTYHATNAAMYTLGYLAVVLLLRLLTRSTAVGIVLLPVIYATMTLTVNGWVDFVNGLLVGTIGTIVLFKRGALAAWAMTFAYYVYRGAPLTLLFDEPHSTIGLTFALAMMALAVYAFHVSLAGRPLFGAIALEDEAVAQ